MPWKTSIPKHLGTPQIFYRCKSKKKLKKLHAHAFQRALYIISSFCFPRKTTEKASVSPIFQHMVNYLVQWKGISYENFWLACSLLTLNLGGWI